MFFIFISYSWFVSNCSKRYSNTNPSSFLILGDLNGHSRVWGCKSNSRRGYVIEEFVNANNLNILSNARSTFSKPNIESAINLYICFCVPRCGFPLTLSNRVQGWAQWPRRISGPLRANPTDVLGCSLQHQLAPQPAAYTPERYERSSPDPPHTVCKQSQPLDEGDSHMSEGLDNAHIAGEQDALAPVDAGLLHLDSQVVGPLPEEC